MEDKTTPTYESFYDVTVKNLKGLLIQLEDAKHLEENRDIRIEIIKAFTYIDEAKDILTGIAKHYESK